jgi:quinoprotein glucose dehydrogenase
MTAIVTGVVVGLVGLALLAGGGWLVALGGSLFYLLAGIGLLIAAGLLIARRRAALWVYAAVLIGTLGWSVAEIGFDWWPLAARGDILFPLGLWLLCPWVTRNLRSDGGMSPRLATAPLWAGVGLSAIVLVLGLTTDIHGRDASLAAEPQVAGNPDANEGQPDDDWRAYGRSQFGQRYSPLAEITPQNVKNLAVAWTFRTGDAQGPNDSGETTFEVTPIKVGDTLYLCSQHQILFALDAKTGKERWRYDPKLQSDPRFQHLTCRGVSYHETMDGAIDTAGAPAPADCRKRIFLPVNDGRLIAVDADTGKPCESFGDHGVLDLQQGMAAPTYSFYEPTSPPVVGEKIVVAAASVMDNYSTDLPSGVIRGYDVYTGKLVWAWDSGSADENALASDTHKYTNNSPNAWMTPSYDPKLGLLYLPMGVETPDIWGGNRSELAERYASALVALDINTGKRVWSYQTVHHDLWDMDLPAQPSLIDLASKDGGAVPAILQPAKTGNIFVLDRRDGKLIVPAPEQPVPQGAAKGDRVSPTQPFSALTFRPQRNLTGADMWGATIFDQLACRILFHQLRYEGPFTPPSEQGTLVFPGNLGMFEWGGIAVDPKRQIAIANPMAIPFVSKLLPRGPDNPDAPNQAHPVGSEIGVQPMYGTPFGVVLHPFLSPIGLPCLRPPWGFMAAIDLKTMQIAWMHRNGTVRDVAPLPIPLKMGVPGLGGPITTAGGVAFATGTQDYYIRAYDVTDGQQVWEDRLPAGGQSTPMTYAIDGHQYVVTAAGGHGSFGTKRGDYVIAYRLR